MSFKSYARWRLVMLVAALAAVAHAQSTPPIKPGLWEVESERMVDGQKMPDPLQALQNVPPEVRKQMEAHLKKQGMDVNAASGRTRVCMTRESLEQGQWYHDDSGCKTEFSSRTSSLWKWRSVCPRPPSESEGEARITSPERYTVKLRAVTKQQGRASTTEMTMNGQWMGADCGSVKPITPPAKSKQP